MAKLNISLQNLFRPVLSGYSNSNSSKKKMHFTKFVVKEKSETISVMPYIIQLALAQSELSPMNGSLQDVYLPHGK